MPCPLVGEPSLEAFAWLPATNDPINHFAQFAYQGCWEAFVHFVGDKMTPAIRRTGEALAANVVRMLDGLMERPKRSCMAITAPTICSSAVPGRRPGARRGGLAGERSRGAGAFDLAYFLSGNVSTEVPLVDRDGPAEALHRHPARERRSGHGLEPCLEDYRFGVLFCLIYSVIVIGTLNTTNARGVAVFHANFERVAAAIADLDAGAMMPQ